MPAKKTKSSPKGVALVDLKKEIAALQEELDTVKNRLARRIRFVEQLLATLPNPAYIFDLQEKRIVFANQMSIPFLGYTTDEILAMDSTALKDLLHPDDFEHVQNHYAAYHELTNDGVFELEFRLKHNFGDWHWISIRETPYEQTPDGMVTRVLGSAEDVTERRLAQEKLWYTSTHDNLTGLYNRSYYEEEISRLERGRRFPVTVMVADIDGLMEVNDKDGYPAGDLLICGAAEIIKACFRGEDVAARIGGDEFGVLLPEIGAVSLDAMRVRIERKIKTYNNSHPKNSLSLTLGFATADSKEALREAVREADRRVTSNKEQARNKKKNAKAEQ